MKKTHLSHKESNKRKELLFEEADRLGRFPTIHQANEFLVDHNYVIAPSVHNRARREWMRRPRESMKGPTPVVAESAVKTARKAGQKLFLSSASLRTQERKLLDELLNLLGFDSELTVRREGEAVTGHIRISGITAPLEGVFK